MRALLNHGPCTNVLGFSELVLLYVDDTNTPKPIGYLTKTTLSNVKAITAFVHKINELSNFPSPSFWYSFSPTSSEIAIEKFVSKTGLIHMFTYLHRYSSSPKGQKVLVDRKSVV